MKAYKGFNKDLTCRGYQYEIGKTYETDLAELCEAGFHACPSPLDVFTYYAPAESRYCEVELGGRMDKGDDKVAAEKITIGAEIGIPGLAKAHIEYTRERCTDRIEAGDAEAATAGDGGAATAGYRGAATAGDRGAATAGDGGAATARGRASVGKKGAALARATHPIASGGIGSVLVLVSEPPTRCDIKHVATVVIDGMTYKPGTLYTLDDVGKVIEYTEGEA